MSRTFEQVRDEAMELSVEERSWLAEQLWDSARTEEERGIDAAWAIEIERRVKEIDDGRAVLIPAEDVLRELKAKYKTPRRRSR